MRFPPALHTALTTTINTAAVPGLVLAVATTNGRVDCLAVGSDAAGHALHTDSLLPVASVTKLATALAVLRLVDQGLLALDAPLSRYLPAAAAQSGVTLRRLLCHSSGLPIDLPSRAAPYALGLNWQALGEACLRQNLERPPQTRVQYSNVGYGLLALLVEALSGQPFPLALEQLVLNPLGIEGYLGSEPPRRVAQLGDVRSPHSGTPLEPFNSAFWRSLAMPWAGLVTNASCALALVRAFMGTPPGFLHADTLAAATSSQTDALAGGFLEPLVWSPCPWGLGPELRGNKTPHWVPESASAGSFGHIGASGALAWADPQHGLAWAILGTRSNQSGWMLRAGPAIAATLIAHVQETAS